ncbi:MAG: bifunctional riboflavin kinase/FAD synthetase [Clostridiales bacterium]|nr:bifunctional riboflavin kinase/FAD synthetase [Clostridiales bacterium]
MEESMDNKRVMALGFFDGIHIGHQALLDQCRNIASENGMLCTVLTFSNHPDRLLLNHDVKTLTTNEQRVEMLKRFGRADEVILLPFDDEMLHLDWQKFFLKILLQKYNAKHLVIGENFRFGFQGLGNPDNLLKKCAEYSIGCDVIKDVKICDQTVSSTKIKEFLKQGNLDMANLFLGHPHEIAGKVLHGRGVGSKHLVPTINFASDPTVLLPPYGVYITSLYLDGRFYPAVTNIGIRPTFDGEDPSVSIESHALGYEGNAYGKTARLELKRFLRSEQRYETANMLLSQIERDIKATNEFFSKGK